MHRKLYYRWSQTSWTPWLKRAKFQKLWNQVTSSQSEKVGKTQSLQTHTGELQSPPLFPKYWNTLSLRESILPKTSSNSALQKQNLRSTICNRSDLRIQRTNITSIYCLQPWTSERHSTLTTLTILKFRLLRTISNPALWKTTVELLTGSEARVRMNGEFGPPIPILKGVGQGRILSTMEYKVDINPLLTALRKMALGTQIGSTNVGHPTCADDIVLTSNEIRNQQAQLSLVASFAGDNHYDIHPTKSKTITHNLPEKHQLQIDAVTVPYVESLTHLGITRADNLHCPDTVITEKIKGARRALYALMGPGLHGVNGMNPQAARPLLQAYVIPRLLFGLEAMVLLQKQIDSSDQPWNKYSLYLTTWPTLLHIYWWESVHWKPHTTKTLHHWWQLH